MNRIRPATTRLCCIASLLFEISGLMAAEPQKVAVLVGINEYKKSAFENLKYAENDVDAAGAEFQKLGFRTTMVKGRDATREKILSTLSDVVKPLGKEDFIILMLCGHGQQLQYVENGVEREDGFFCPYDAERGVNTTLLSLSHVVEMLADSVGTRIVLVDACREENQVAGRRGIQGKTYSIPEGTAILFACSAGQRSFELPPLKHGVFTYCLVDSLRKAQMAGGEVTWGNVVESVFEQMSSEDIRKQMPEGFTQRPIKADALPRTVLAAFDRKSLHAEMESDPALAAATKAILGRPNDSSAYLARGDLFVAKGEFDSAIADYNEAIRLDPKFAQAYNSRALVWGDKSEDERAIADYNEAIRLDPKYAVPYANRAYIWKDRGNYDRAIADCNEAIRLDPACAEAYHSRALAWYGKSDYDQAIADFSEVIRIDPKYVWAYHNRAVAWKEMGEYDKAIADCSESIRLEPEFAIAYRSRGDIWGIKGAYDRAIADYDEAIRLDPMDPHTFSNRASLLASCPKSQYRNGTKAVDDATRACDLSVWKNHNYLDVLAAAHAEKGDFDKALEYVRRAMALDAEYAKNIAPSCLELYRAKKPYRTLEPLVPDSQMQQVDPNDTGYG